MHLYKITNIVNNKSYIGMTRKQDPYERWANHLNDVKYSKKPLLVHKAIRKYGKENFSFEVIESFTDITDQQLLEKEAELIVSENTLVPNGYNVLIKGTISHPKLFAEMHSRLKQGLASCKRKTSKYIGVSNYDGQISASIRVMGVKYNNFMFKTEIDAAEAYDKLAIKFFGRTARTNFQENKYTDDEVEENLKKFIFKDLNVYTSKLDCIHFSRSKGLWVVQVKKKFVGHYDTEEEAIQALEQYKKYLNDPEEHKKPEPSCKMKLRKILKTLFSLKSEGKTYEEISVITGLNYARVYNLMYRYENSSLLQ